MVPTVVIPPHFPRTTNRPHGRFTASGGDQHRERPIQRFIDNSLKSNWLWLTIRVCLTLMFVTSGLAKLFDCQASLEGMHATNPELAQLLNIVAAVTLLAGSTLVLLNRKLWLGAGALAVFLLLTILIVHTFWSRTGVEAKLAMFFALEHIAVIGGLITTAITSVQRQRLRQDISVTVTYQKA